MLKGEDLASSSTSDISSFRSEVCTPTILVSPAADKVVDFQSGFEEATNGNGVKDRAKQLESLGFVPRSNSTSGASGE
uniref:Uncharacterized protein n=1 Tax=Caenorhabditis japonica TaxID=281687 RepID=A0A8R1IKV6_CAEJA